MTGRDNISIRKFKPTDVDGIINLLTIVFNTKFTKEWWDWKYRSNPNGFLGEDGDIWVAEVDNEIIGHYAIMPEKLKINSKIIRAAQSIDTATHPDYRRRGLFTSLASKVYDDAKDRYPFIYGFPSEMAYKGFIKLGWRDIKISSFCKVLDYDAVLSTKFGNKLVRVILELGVRMIIKVRQWCEVLCGKGERGSIIEIEEIDVFPTEIDDFCDEASKNYSFILERTHKYLNWRFSRVFGNYQIYIARSIQDKGIMGYIVLHKRENILNIVDLVTLQGEDEAMVDLIDKAIEVGNTEGVDLIHCLYPKRCRQAGVFIRRGFFSPNEILRFLKKYSLRYILYDLSSRGITPDVDSWYYTLADTDAA